MRLKNSKDFEVERRTVHNNNCKGGGPERFIFCGWELNPVQISPRIGTVHSARQRQTDSRVGLLQIHTYYIGQKTSKITSAGEHFISIASRSLTIAELGEIASPGRRRRGYGGRAHRTHG